MARKRTEEMAKECAQAERELNQALFSREISACYEKYEQLGSIYKSMNRDEDAIKCFEYGLEMIKGQRLLEWFMYMNLGEVHRKLNHVDYMFECLGLAFDLARGADDMSLLADVFECLGIAFHESLKSTSKAINCFEEALAIQSLINKDECILPILFNLGMVYYSAEQYDESSQYLTRYMKLNSELDRQEKLRKALLPQGNNIYHKGYMERYQGYSRNKDLLQALGLIADIKNIKGDYDDAINYYEKSLAIAKKVADNRKIATIHFKIGYCYHYGYKLTEAAKWLEEALSLAKELNDQKLQVQISYHLSNIHHLTGENARSISIVNSAKDEIDNDEKYKGHSRNDVEFLWMKSKRELDSHLLSEANLTAIDALLNCKGDDEKRVGCFLQLAEISLRKGSYDNVKENLAKVWKICERQVDCHNKLLALQIYIDMYIKLHQYDLARENASKYLEIACTTAHNIFQFEGYFNLGLIALLQNDLAAAEKYYHEIVKLNSDIKKPSPDFMVCQLHYLIETAKPGTTLDTCLVLLLQSLGAALKSGRTEEMAEVISCVSDMHCFCQNIDDPKIRVSGLYKYFLKTGLVHNERILRSYGEHDTHKVSSLKNFIATHKKLVTFLIDNDETDEALVFADRGRMSILQDILRKKYRMAVADESESEASDLGGMRDIAVIEKCSIVFFLMLEDCLMIWIISEKEIECQKITKFVCEERELVFAEETGPEYYLGKVVYNLDAVVGQDSGFRGATSKDFEDEEGSECGDEDLMIPNLKVSEYRGDTADDNEDDLSTKLMSCNQFELLHDWLIAPIQDKLTEDRFLIIPDKFMFQIPFNALKDKTTGKCLVDTKIVRLAPSLMTLQLLNDPSSLHKHSKGGALVVAADDVGKVKYDGKEKIFLKLKYAAKEAEMIGKLLQVDPLIGKEASKRLVVEQLSGDHKILHVAAHGIFPGKIILTPNDTSTGCLPREDDYMLHMSDVMKMGVRAQLVVLSCCSSGDGPQTAEGIIGFGRAFLAGGARAVVVALWDVRDRATFLLMEKFYQCFVDGKSASESLNEAVKALKSIEKYKDEKIWAPFVLLGGEVYWNEKNEPVATTMPKE